jgi:hypothetical protein
VEKIYGPASEYENDDADNGGTGPGTFPACVPKAGTLFICPGNFQYFKSGIGVTPITNLDISYQFYKRLKVTVGANNLFNKFPPLLNATLRAHEDSFCLWRCTRGYSVSPRSRPLVSTVVFITLRLVSNSEMRELWHHFRSGYRPDSCRNVSSSPLSTAVASVSISFSVIAVERTPLQVLMSSIPRSVRWFSKFCFSPVSSGVA